MSVTITTNGCQQVITVNSKSLNREYSYSYPNENVNKEDDARLFSQKQAKSGT